MLTFTTELYRYKGEGWLLEGTKGWKLETRAPLGLIDDGTTDLICRSDLFLAGEIIRSYEQYLTEEVLEDLAVGASAGGVEEPAPFVEVSDHVGDVDAEHSCRLSALGRVGVIDGQSRIE